MPSPQPLRRPEPGGTAAPACVRTVAVEPSVAVNEDPSRGPGSIAYRDCRPRAHARPDAGCRRLGHGVDHLAGAARQQALALCGTVCPIAGRYLVMR